MCFQHNPRQPEIKPKPDPSTQIASSYNVTRKKFNERFMLLIQIYLEGK